MMEALNTTQQQSSQITSRVNVFNNTQEEHDEELNCATTNTLQIAGTNKKVSTNVDDDNNTKVITQKSELHADFINDANSCEANANHSDEKIIMHQNERNQQLQTEKTNRLLSTDDEQASVHSTSPGTSNRNSEITFQGSNYESPTPSDDKTVNDDELASTHSISPGTYNRNLEVAHHYSYRRPSSHNESPTFTVKSEAFSSDNETEQQLQTQKSNRLLSTDDEEVTLHNMSPATYNRNLEISFQSDREPSLTNEPLASNRCLKSGEVLSGSNDEAFANSISNTVANENAVTDTAVSEANVNCEPNKTDEFSATNVVVGESTHQQHITHVDSQRNIVENWRENTYSEEDSRSTENLQFTENLSTTADNNNSCEQSIASHANATSTIETEFLKSQLVLDAPPPPAPHELAQCDEAATTTHASTSNSSPAQVQTTFNRNLSETNEISQAQFYTKVNGEHKINELIGATHTQEAVENPKPMYVADIQNGPGYVDFQNEAVENLNNTLSTNNDDDSRCSSIKSMDSDSSAHSTSSQPLVIDQPLDEGKVSPLRLTLKRKLSGEGNEHEFGVHYKRKQLAESVEAAAQPVAMVTTYENLTNVDEQASTQPSNDNAQALFPIGQISQASNMGIQPSAEPEKSTVPMLPTVQPPAEPSKYLCLRCNSNEYCTQNALEDHQRSCPVILKYPVTQNYYKCTTCGTYHENWNLFLHIREQHEQFLCLYCIRCFPTAEKLSLHLEMKHDLEQDHYNSEETFRNSAKLLDGYALESRFLLCCTCQHIFRESTAFTEHICVEYIKPCSFCGQKGRHTSQCRAHPFTKRRIKRKVKEKAPANSLKPIQADIVALEPNEATTSTTTTEVTAVTTATTMTTATDSTITPTLQTTKPSDLNVHNDDSNSSSNMVIDESCNTDHSQTTNINTYKTLNELKRQHEQQQQPLQQLQQRALESYEENNANTVAASPTVLKFKLRVPREYQKPVDEAISSSESDEANFEEDVADGASNQHDESLITTAALKGPPADAVSVGDDETRQYTSEAMDLSVGNISTGLDNTEEDNDSCGDEAQTHLARILKEIEQTKLDIQRTKETIHHHHHHQHSTKTIVGDSEKHKQSMTAMVEKEAVIEPAQLATLGTPTPPASPRAVNAAQHSTLAEQMPSGTAVEAINIASIDGTQTTSDVAANGSGDVATNESSEATNITATQHTVTDDEFLKSSVAEAASLEDLSTLPAPTPTPPPPSPPADGIQVANEDCLIVELQLDRPLDKFEIVEFIRICLKAAYPFCLYCNHARRIAVNAESLVLHLIAQHRFTATVDSITAEELQPATIVIKLKSFLPALATEYLNSNSYCTIGNGAFTRHFNERIFECFQCRFVTSTHKELYLHNRKMHLRTAILCFMCRCNFFSFSEILCHICPGMSHKASRFEVKFRCCLCDMDNIPSPFRLMVHLRKRHFACDICLEDCRDQSRLSSHVWKHKLHHLCYRCGIAYRNKMDITKHLFWKHGTESTICKRCLNKRWPHVYHFCVPPTTFTCDVCQLGFSKAMHLTVHKRLHAGDFRYTCNEENCEAKFISRRLLLKHAVVHQVAEEAVDKETTATETDNKAEEQLESVEKMTAFSLLTPKPSEDSKLDDAAAVSAATPATGEQLPLKTFEEAPTTAEVKAEIKDEASQAATAPETESPTLDKTRRKKKRKRAKESLEDLNLTAPNLSESGSSSESESETKSAKCEEESSKMPAISPLNELALEKSNEIDESPSTAPEDTGKVLEIWKNFLEAQQASGANVEEFTEYSEDNYPTPATLHVCSSDHDYCSMFPTQQQQKQQQQKQQQQTKQATTKRRNSNTADAASSSSDESSDSNSSSSCSCGSNCSCSGGSSSSSSSSGSSDDSDSSTDSHKRHRKRSERSNRHKKSESLSPLKNRSTSEAINVTDLEGGTPQAEHCDEEMAKTNDEIETAAKSSEPLINESDLETAESETDEEYYDEHPQKMASELLSQKRAQLIARTLLSSPTHNFDIVENSRPSTPSLPEEVNYEKRKKKKKRERKSTLTSKTQLYPNTYGLAEATASSASLHNGTAMALTNYPAAAEQAHTTEFLHRFPATPEPTIRHPPAVMQLSGAAHRHRISEGSSCSDVDGSLKRSKRTRRPNKFYGYTSDDENQGNTALGQQLLIGMRAFKPQPPPQLVWHKEDLPSPTKSKKTARAHKKHDTLAGTPAGYDEAYQAKKARKSKLSSSSKSQQQQRKQQRSTKKLLIRSKLPPIPRLKLRPALFGMQTTASTSLSPSFDPHNPPQTNVNAAEDDDDDDIDESSDASSDAEAPPPQRHGPTYYQVQETVPRFPAPPTPAVIAQLPTSQQQQLQQHQQQIQQIQQQIAALPPTPQTTVFNHKIPPALLPNPDFATLQYFKANNIRYPIRPPAGARAAREGESVYCYCRCPYDEVSEMIACDGDNCLIEWFHFECVGIMVAPQGKWFCAECRPQYSEELYPTTTNTIQQPSVPGIMPPNTEH